jgi:hypothetical protein
MMAIKAFAVRSSPRNSSSGEEAILFEIKPNLDYSMKSDMKRDGDEEWI